MDAIRARHHTELHVRQVLDRPLRASDVEELLGRIERAGAHTLRAVALGSCSDVAPSEVDPRVVVAPAQYGHVPHSSLEVLAMLPHPDVDLEVLRVGPATTVVRSDGGRSTRFVHVGARPSGRDTYEQVRSELNEVEKHLATAGLTSDAVDRTWFYLHHIETTYSELNAARDEVFERWSMSRLPASTAVGAALAGGGAAVVVEAAARDGVARARAIESRLQRPPREYGPRFARASMLELDGLDVLNISGISSIDAEGCSLVGDDPYDLVSHAMAGFTDLLRRCGFTIEDVRSAQVYSTDAAVLEALRRWEQVHETRLPASHNAVDLCRPELRFEIEGRAVRMKR